LLILSLNTIIQADLIFVKEDNDEREDSFEENKGTTCFFSTRLTLMFLPVSCEMCAICCMCGMSLKIADSDLDIFLFKIFMC